MHRREIIWATVRSRHYDNALQTAYTAYNKTTAILVIYTVVLKLSRGTRRQLQEMWSKPIRFPGKILEKTAISDTVTPRSGRFDNLWSYSHCTLRIAGSDSTRSVPTAMHVTVPPFASLRTPLKVTTVLSSPVTVIVSIPVKIVSLFRVTGVNDPLGVNRQP